MIVYVPLNATHSSEILSIGAQVFREDDVSVLGDALHTACVSSCVASFCAKCTERTEAPCTPWVQGVVASSCAKCTGRTEGVVALAPDGSVAAFAIFCRSSPISTRLSLYHQYYTSLFVQIGNVATAANAANAANANANANATANANAGSGLVELAFLAVHPRHQGAGIGAHLLTKCLGDLKTSSASSPPCWLVVDADNVGAQRLYERQGFIPVAPLLGTPYPSLIMFRFSGKIEIKVLSWIQAALLCNPISDGGNDSNMCAMDTIDDTPFCDSQYNTPPRVSSPIRPISVASLHMGS